MSQNYNINMKKFNGTDYDNLLPLAYNALNSQQLDGKTFNEIQNLLNARAQIATGSYVGNGVYTSPTQINIGFKPKLIFIGDGLSISSLNPFVGGEAPYKYVNGVNTNWFSFNSYRMDGSTYDGNVYSNFSGAMFAIDDIPYNIYYDGTNMVRYAVVISASFDSGVVSLTQTSYTASHSDNVVNEFRNAKFQFNGNNITYYYTAIG